MTKTPVLTIITRTSARPNSFKRLVNSISQQTYKQIKHIVLCDNETAYHYATATLQQAPYSYVVEKVEKNSNRRGFYNLYLNHGINMVNDGYMMFIDDDDYIVNNTSIEKFWKHPKPDEGFYIVQFTRGRRAKPRPVYFRKNNYKAGDLSPFYIDIGKIGGSCVIFTKQQSQHARWDDRLSSDFRFIKQLATHNNYTFIPITIVKATSEKNGGAANDIQL